MKKTLLLLFVCLFGALGGVKAYTVGNLTEAGWSEVSAISDDASNENYVGNFVYVFVDAGSSNFVLSGQTTTVDGYVGNKPTYRTLANPCVTPYFVWTLEVRNGGFAMRNIVSAQYFNSNSSTDGTTKGWGWEDTMSDDYPAGTFTFTINSGKYDIQGVSSQAYVGPWSEDGVANDGEAIAANKDNTKAAGSAPGPSPGFFIYRMAKATYLRNYLKQVPNLASPVDASYLIVNPTIYQANNDNTLPAGWSETNITTDHRTSTGAGTNTKLKINNEDWLKNGKGDYYTTINNLPNGLYRVTAGIRGNDNNASRFKVYVYEPSTQGREESDGAPKGDMVDRTTYPDLAITTGTANIGVYTTGDIGTKTVEADNFRMETDPYISSIATEFNNGVEMTAGLWYHFKVDNTGNHILTATNLSNIIYATGSTTALSAAGSATFTATQELTAGTDYYVRSSSANTLTITPCISAVATALPANDPMTAGEWYYFDVATAGHYDVVASSITNIVYTTNGDLAEDASVASKFSVKNNELSATRYYVKSSSAQTLQWFLTDNKDCTGYIKNPSFDEAISDANWTLTSGAVDYWSVFERVATGGVEEYNRPTIKCEQTITNLPSGVYKVTVQGYYRGGGGGYTEDARNAKLFANDEEVDLMSINDYKGITTPPGVEGATWQHINNSFYVPDNTVAANYAINTLNQYKNEVTVAVSNGTLTIGVKKDAAVGSDWTYFDNFTLTYTGPYNEVVENTETKTQTYEGTFTEDVDFTPTAECPIVDITGASFIGNIDVSFAENPNGLIIATSAQKIELNYLKEEPVKNIISTKDNLSDKVVITDGYPFVAPFDFQAQEARYSRTVGASTNFGTICVPFALTSNDDIQYYTTDQITGGVLKLIAVDDVTAGTPAIFKKKNSGATSISVHTTGTAIEKDAGSQGESVRLVGKFERYVVGDEGGTTGTAANGNYFISSDVFYEGADYIIVKPFRAYLETVGVIQSRLTLQIDDETTAINELKTIDEKQGLQDGKYLIDGKIIVVKEGKQFNVNGVIK